MFQTELLLALSTSEREEVWRPYISLKVSLSYPNVYSYPVVGKGEPGSELPGLGSPSWSKGGERMGAGRILID